MSSLESRVENASLLRRVIPVEEAIRFVSSPCTLAVSGFTKAGEPKAFLRALAQDMQTRAPNPFLTLLSGASLSDEVEDPLAPFILRRGPFISAPASRRLIHAGKMDFCDVHLSQFARNLVYGFYGDIDLAVIEVSRIRPDGSVILSSSMGISAEALMQAKAVVLEVNTAVPDYTGFHDVFVPPRHPEVGWPIPITGVGDRAGTPYVAFDHDKVVGVIESRIPEYPVAFKPTTEVERRIAENVIAFLEQARVQYGWNKRIPPIQSGVGNIANAVVGELYRSPFRKLRFWTEVFQDGMLRFVQDDEKFDCASATAVSLSADGYREFYQQLDRCRDRLVLRPMWVSNCAELITRLFVIAMNTPVEVDIYGHVNSTHVDGSRIINGIGGSGDFFRNAYLGVVHTPSVRTLHDGRTVSCIMPYVRHIDHTEHDIKCIATEQGFTFTTEIRSGRNRALDIIEHCAHPHFRPLLRDYLDRAGGGDEPRPTQMKVLAQWWDEYEAACREFPSAA